MVHTRHDRRLPHPLIQLALTTLVLVGGACGDEAPLTSQGFVSRTAPPTAAQAEGTPPLRTHEALCRPCRTSAECAAETADSVCTPLGSEGSFCATTCDAANLCPTGYSCALGVCRPESNTCSCNQRHEGAVTACAFDVATTRCNGTRTCEGAALSACLPLAGEAPACSGTRDDCADVTDPAQRALVGTPCDGDDDDACADGLWTCSGAGIVCSDDATSRRELCNGLDDDCDGLTDEDFRDLGAPCDGADADACMDGVIVCDPDGLGTICDDDAASKVEVCNGLDDDCNGLTDDGVDCTPPTQEVCYPGVNFDWSVCFDLVPASSINLAAYTYAASADTRYRAPDFYLDLQAISGNPNLSANFKLTEFMQVAKGRYALYRPQTVAHWQRIRASVGAALTVNSGYRSPGYNAGIDGSATFSRHLYGDAADVAASGAVSLQRLATACNAEGADYVQLYTTHIHCDWRDDAHTQDFWLATPRPFRANPSVSPDPWANLWGDIEITALNDDETLLAALWGPAFDEGEPWVTWEIRAPDALETVVVEPATSVVVPAGSRVRWRIGGLVEGQIELP